MTSSHSGKSVLLTLGRLPVALDLARGFCALGWRVVIAEPFGMHLARMSRSVSKNYQVRPPVKDRRGYLEDLARIVERESIDLVVPVSEETLYVSMLHDQLKGVRLYCPAQADLLKLHDKLAFNQLASRLGLSVPRSCSATDSHAEDLTRDPFVAKPRMSCSGRGVEIHTGNFTGSFPADYVLQQRIFGDEFSSFTVARDGRVLRTVVYRARATSGCVAVVFERVDNLDAIEAWVSTLIEHTSYTGFFSCDFILDQSGTPYALECNPRTTSGIHFLQPATLAQSIAGADTDVALRSDRLLQEAYSSYTALLGALNKPDERRSRWHLLRTARDVTWSRQDPWPFLLMSVNSYPLIWQALRRRNTFAEVAALDIEWREHA